MVAIAVAFVLSVIGAAIQQDRNHQREEYERLLRESDDAASEITASVAGVFDGAETLLWGIAQAVTFAGDSPMPDTPSLERFLGRFHSRVPYIANLTIIGPDGDDVASSMRSDFGLTEHSGQSYFEQLVRGARSSYVTPLLADPGSRARYMLILRRIDLADGGFVGSVAAALEIGQLDKLAISRLGVSPAIQIAVFDRQDTLIIAKGDDVVRSELRHGILAQGRGRREIVANGKAWVADVRTIEGTGLTIATFFDRAHGGHLHPESLGLVLIVCFGIAGAAWWAVARLREEEKLAIELTASRQEMADITEASSDWFWEQGPDLKFTKVGGHSDAPLKTELLIGHDRMAFADPNYDPAGLARHLAELRGRRPFRDFKYRRVLPDGSSRVILTSGKPIFGESGEFLGYRGSARDVTEQELQRQQFDKLAAFNHLMVMAIDCATNGVMITDPRRPGNPVVFVNRAFTRISGYSSADVVGRGPGRTLHPDCDPAARARIERAVAERIPDTVVLLCRRKDDVAFWNEVSIAPTYDERGELVAFVCIHSDVTGRFETERRRQEAEDQLRQVQKMEAIGTLAGGVAHDLNNALVPIIMLSELMQEDLPAESPHRESVASVLSAAEHSRQLVAKLLQISRREESERAPVDLAACIGAAIELARLAAPPAIAIDKDLASDALRVVGNQVQLTQVILNLMTNAIHALGKSGSIRVSLQRAAAAERPEILKDSMIDTFARITVTDNGPGMPDAIRQRIFEPFFTTKPPGEGTGLGLAVVHNIVHGLGGAITVASTVGVGTEFQIFLPLEEESQALEQTT